MHRLVVAPTHSVEEAEEKVLYLVSLTIAFNKQLSSAQVTAIAASLRPFRTEVRSLFYGNQRRDENPAQES
jgi:hypothetical protein